MRVLILFDRPPGSARPDEVDGLAQAAEVERTLVSLGHEAHRLALDLDLSELERALRDLRAEVVFNLVESLGGKGRLIAVVPESLEALAMPYTGAPARALRATSDKLAAKRRLRAQGLPTPDHVELGHDSRDFTPGRFVIKSVWEHASLGLEDDSVVQATSVSHLHQEIERRRATLGGFAFAERYIPGREFNLSLLAGPNTPEVLPPAEILFEGFAADRPRILGYRAKWDPQSFEYNHTPRSFEFPPEDRDLLERLCALAREAWASFDLRGFARVDFRVDEGGAPWILEVNANPCLSPDAGFAAALERKGSNLREAVARILDDAVHSKA